MQRASQQEILQSSVNLVMMTDTDSIGNAGESDHDEELKDDGTKLKAEDTSSSKCQEGGDNVSVSQQSLDTPNAIKKQSIEALRSHNDLPKYIQMNQNILTFPEKLMLCLVHVENHCERTGEVLEDKCVGWTLDGTAILIKDKEKFCQELIAPFLGKQKFHSLRRKLYRWGFRKVNMSQYIELDGNHKKGHVGFTNPNFIRADRNLVSSMKSVAVVKSSSDKKRATEDEADDDEPDRKKPPPNIDQLHAQADFWPIAQQGGRASQPRSHDPFHRFPKAGQTGWAQNQQTQHDSLGYDRGGFSAASLRPFGLGRGSQLPDQTVHQNLLTSMAPLFQQQSQQSQATTSPRDELPEMLALLRQQQQQSPSAANVPPAQPQPGIDPSAMLMLLGGHQSRSQPNTASPIASALQGLSSEQLSTLLPMLQQALGPAGGSPSLSLSSTASTEQDQLAVLLPLLQQQLQQSSFGTQATPQMFGNQQTPLSAMLAFHQGSNTRSDSTQGNRVQQHVEASQNDLLQRLGLPMAQSILEQAGLSVGEAPQNDNTEQRDILDLLRFLSSQQRR